ncbi:hypothetical protein LOAG_11206 [Loa loa]|uniref:BZIP domain-containing protein n=1 Tax=Loa loa TaxID=7209 RepID=A0A1S0TNY1_LOALO|nr:hypothetical protein LOAG_11206 [Loa loa]EFO17293.2 hypothetical protein LOAG_11206 [Loa loa]
MMGDQFSVVPFWAIPSPEVDNLLPDCFIGYNDNSASEATSRCSSSVSKLSTELGGNGLEDVLERSLTSAAVQNDEGQFLCSLDSESGKPSYYDGSDISWLNEFMNVYGITTLDSNDDFNMKNIDMTVVTTPQTKENQPAAVLTPVGEMKNGGILTNKCVIQPSIIPNNVSMASLDVSIAADTNTNMFSVCKANTVRKTVEDVIADNDKTTHSSVVKVLHGSAHQKNSTVPPSDHGQKFIVNRTCFDGISERKREQNRCAAIRYRGKRREEAKQKKEELHKLELRNIELKAEMNCLEKEVIYLRSLMELARRP